MPYIMTEEDWKKWRANQVGVLEEFEKRLARASLELAKKAQTGQATEKIEDVGDAAQQAEESVDSLADKVDTEIGSAADDEDLEDEEPTPPTEEEHAIARQALISELREMAIKASREGNTKLAYKIERTVDELIFEN
jgi:hypothetical protein